MNALPVLLISLCVVAIVYRYYHGWIAAKVACLNDERITPAHKNYDGHNFYPLKRWVLFGHHFAAITGAGPLIGPVLAAQFGFLPGWIWILVGVTLGGAVHDFIILMASIRRNGKSLVEIARMEIGILAGTVASLAVLFILIISIAVMGLVVANSLAESAWATFTLFMTIPIALFMGMNMFKWRPGSTLSTSIVGVVLLISSVVVGKFIPETSFAHYFVFSHEQLSVMIGLYGFLASILPVWMLLAPRDYLSAFMKIGTIALLAVAVMAVHPVLKMPLFTPFIHGGGPIIPGKLFPFCFVTIACGAISGFHSIISSGTTSKMLDKESDARPIGFGAMLCESMIAVIALIAACSLYPADYYAINAPAAKFAALHMQTVHLDQLSAEVKENLMGRTGGAVSFAVGVAQIFSRLPFMNHLMDYWYHFAILFEALFVLTVVDAGTRAARFILQEALGKFYKPFEAVGWLPGTLLTSGFVALCWGYLLYTGSIAVLWPLFGIANQLLAAVALSVATTVLINEGRARYAWVTLLPLAFLATTTLWAGIENIPVNLIPLVQSGKTFQGYLNISLDIAIMACVIVILSQAFLRWMKPTSGILFDNILPDKQALPGIQADDGSQPEAI